MNNLIVWSKMGRLRAAFAESIHQALMFEGRKYGLQDFYLGDVDYLRDERGKLVGFAYILEEGRLPEMLRHMEDNQKVYVRDGMLFIKLSNTTRFNIETVQAIGTNVYCDIQKDCILVIPDSGFGEIAFDLASDGIPKGLSETNGRVSPN